MADQLSGADWHRSWHVVGVYGSITQQIEHKLLKRGFQFEVIAVGTSRPHYMHGRAISNLSGSGY